MFHHLFLLVDVDSIFIEVHQPRLDEDQVEDVEVGAQQPDHVVLEADQPGLLPQEPSHQVT